MSLRPVYRFRQFWLALLGCARPIDEAKLRRYLTAEQLALFRRMSAAEQAHALAVLRTLPNDSEQGAANGSALTQAALLHDAGKVGGRIRIGHRVVTVLLSALYPALLQRLALDEPRSWRYPFFVLLHHAERGAGLVAEAGTDPLVVALIRMHHTAPQQSGLDAPGRALLDVLQSADEKN